MISLSKFRGDTALVVGLGKSGRTAAHALRKAGANVLVWDDTLDQRTQAADAGYTVFDTDASQFADIDQIIWSPGVPHTWPTSHPLAEKAKAAGLTLRCDVDLLAETQTAARYVGITGTNGKSTSTALTGHVLAAAGLQTEVGGNLGVPALELSALEADGVYVLELSSYQTELTPHLACDTAVLLNISPDHLDRHGGLDGYAAAKAKLFENQKDGACAIVGTDDARSRAVAEALEADNRLRVIRIGAAGPVKGGIGVRDGILNDDVFGQGDQIDLRGLPALPGQHNWQNAAAAYAIARTHGVGVNDIESGLGSFPGLRHRQERVGVKDNVSFVNDSKATNADAAGNAVRCYDCVYWIAGGVAKAGGITTLGPLFGRIRRAYLIGEAADAFSVTLNDNDVAWSVHDSLESAVTQAGNDALRDGETGATVLLSPACASFDMYANFEDRGDAFRTSVHGTWPEARL